MRHTPTVVTAFLAAALACGPASADDTTRMALARELMTQIHEGDTVLASLPLLSADLRKALVQQGRASQDADDFVARYEKRFTAEIGRFSDSMAEAYAQAMTEEDLAAVIAFNKTPVGQRFIAIRPALTQAAFLAMHRFEQDVAKEVTDDIAAAKDAGSPPRKM